MSGEAPVLQIEADGIRLRGTLTLETVPGLETALAEVPETLKWVDLQAVTAIDSAGIAWLSLLAGHRRTSECRLVVRHAPEALKTLAQLYELSFLDFSSSQTE